MLLKIWHPLWTTWIGVLSVGAEDSIDVARARVIVAVSAVDACHGARAGIVIAIRAIDSCFASLP